MSVFSYHQAKGQTVLEMIFTVGVLLLVVAAVLALVTTNATGQAESETQILANNLAREGIEVIRNIRDSNSLAGLAWNSGLDITPADQIGQADFSNQSGGWRWTYTPAASAESGQLYLDQGRYTHVASATSQVSLFQRRLRIQAVCELSDGSERLAFAGGSCDPGETLIGLKLTATVLWEDNGRSRQIQLHDVLYDWK